MSSLSLGLLGGSRVVNLISISIKLVDELTVCAFLASM